MLRRLRAASRRPSTNIIERAGRTLNRRRTTSHIVREAPKQHLPAAIAPLKDVRHLTGMHAPAPRKCQVHRRVPTVLGIAGKENAAPALAAKWIFPRRLRCRARIFVDLHASARGSQLGE